MGESSYPIESSDDERGRLIRQARYYRPYTERLFRSAGIREGMHVLDFGCGAGDVSFIAADIVGPNGRVLGVDRDAGQIAYATRRAREEGRTNVAFMQGGFEDQFPDGPWDAAVGRFVLMYLNDPAAALRSVALQLRAGSPVAFHEMNLGSHSGLDFSWPPREGGVQRMADDLYTELGKIARPLTGMQLPDIFLAAGLDISDWGFEVSAPVLSREQTRANYIPATRGGVRIVEPQGMKVEESAWRATQDWLDGLPPGYAAVLPPLCTLGWARTPR